MAVRKSRRVIKDESISIPEMRQPMMMEQPKSMWDKIGPVMAVVLVVAAFALGSMWTKISFLEKGVATNANTAAR